jgi:hypothetical protein
VYAQRYVNAFRRKLHSLDRRSAIRAETNAAEREQNPLDSENDCGIGIFSTFAATDIYQFTGALTRKAADRTAPNCKRAHRVHHGEKILHRQCDSGSSPAGFAQKRANRPNRFGSGMSVTASGAAMRDAR